MDTQRLKKTSKSLSLVLRHDPGRVGLSLDAEGWVDVDRLLAAMRIDRGDLEQIVRENDKRRFAFDATGTRIRANQGHSVPVDLGLAKVVPPDVLYHGTPEGSVAAIPERGLDKMARHAVHLSPDVETATRVGSRRGKAVVFRVDARRMAQDGYEFERSANGVWLVDSVPAGYLSRLA